MSSVTRLYTPQMLALAVELSQYPLDQDLPHVGHARSEACGSEIALGVEQWHDCQILRAGAQVQACAVGQAAAAIFLRHAVGLKKARIAKALSQIDDWCAGGVLPDWPDFVTLKDAQSYPGRHGAVRLPWRAALNALCSLENPR